MKIRDLQTSDSHEGHKPSFSLEVFSTKGGDLRTEGVYDAENLIVKDLDHWISSLDDSKVDLMKRIIDSTREERIAIPLVFVIGNDDTVALRNLFVEVSLCPNPELEKMTEDMPSRVREFYTYSSLSERVRHHFMQRRKPLRDWQSIIDQWREGHGLRLTDGKWTFSFTWDALQPQRKRLVEPILYAVAARDTEIKAEAKIFTDSLPKPLT
jgi:hypothetical protein